MKALVVYGTRSGCTTGIAERIGARLAEGGATVEVVPAGCAPEPSAYDAVFVGSGVRAGSWHADTAAWVRRHAETLKGKKVAFFTVGLSLTDPSKAGEARAYTDPLIAESGVTPAGIGLFAGWFEPKRFSFLERSILKLMKAPVGDHRDFAAAERWAEDTLAQLQA